MLQLDRLERTQFLQGFWHGYIPQRSIYICFYRQKSYTLFLYRIFLLPYIYTAVSLLLSYCKKRTRGTYCDVPYEKYVFGVIIVIVSMKSNVLGARKQVRNRHHPVQKHIKP